MQEQSPLQPESGRGQDALTRRRLVRLGWITAVLVVVGGQLWLLLKLFFAPLAPGEGPSGPAPTQSRQGRGQFTLGPLEQFPVGSVTHFRPGRFLLVRQPTGVLALSDECTHQKCTVDYLPERDVIACPCHGAQFSVTGAVLAGPAPRPLDRFATTVQDGRVVVDTTHRSTS
jgi:Rieske Fe-S protein